MRSGGGFNNRAVRGVQADSGNIRRLGNNGRISYRSSVQTAVLACSGYTGVRDIFILHAQARAGEEGKRALEVGSEEGDGGKTQMNWARVALISVLSASIMAVCYFCFAPYPTAARFFTDIAYQAVCIMCSTALVFFITRPRKDKDKRTKNATKKESKSKERQSKK